MRKIITASPCLSFLVTPATAQQQTLNETLQVRLVEFDAVVTDRKGNPVPGLGPEDFELYQNGVRREITNFTEYRDGEDVSAAASEVAAEQLPPPQPRTIVVLIDALRLGGKERKQLFSDLREMVERTMREGDRGQVLTWHDRKGLGTLTEMTFSRAEMIEAVTTAEATLHGDMADTTLEAQIEWIRDMGATPHRDGPEFQFGGEKNTSLVVREAAERKLSVMRRKTAAIQRVLPAIAEPTYRNVLIYVSGGFPMFAGQDLFTGLRASLEPGVAEDFSTAPMLDTITRTANTHGVIVYALRPHIAPSAARMRSSVSRMEPMMDMAPGGDDEHRTFGGFEMQQRLPDASLEAMALQNDVQALSVLAQETGGSVAIGTSGITEAVDKIAQDLGSYYTLAYRVTSDGADRERRIDLRPKNRNHKVRMRRTILDRSHETRARDLLVARLFEHGEGGDIEFDIEAGEGKPGKSHQVLIPIELTIPVEQLQFEEEGDDFAARFSVILVAGANIGEITRMTEASRRIVAEKGTEPVGVVRFDFELLTAPSPTNVSIAVFDEKSGLAGVQSMVVEGRRVQGDTILSAPAADTAWYQAMRRANEERKPILAYFRPPSCSTCSRFERTLEHPAIQRRLADVELVQMHPTAGEIGKIWNSRDPGLGVFDRLGNFRMHFEGLPDTVTLATILNDISDAAPHFERAVTAAENGRPDDGELDAAIAYMMLGRESDARESLDTAIGEGAPEIRQYARTAKALLDSDLKRPDAASEPKRVAALEELDRIIATALTPQVAGEAWLTIGLIHRMAGSREAAAEAIVTAKGLLSEESRIAASSPYARSALEDAPGGNGPIQILRPAPQLLTGRVTIKTRVASAEVTAVAFELDGVQVGTVRRPPFSASIDFGQFPEQRVIRVTALDGLGVQIGRDSLTVNEGGERFWLRLVEPREGDVEGPTRIRMKVRSPSTESVKKVTVSWNDAVVAVVRNAPWETNIRIPAELGVLRCVAELTDGRTAEDAVLLNAYGHVERADVPLVELPVTFVDAVPDTKTIRDEIFVREGARFRTVDSVLSAAEALLTVGLIIDTSGSMEKSLMSVQEAAIGFLETVLGERDRAFLIGFSTRASLVQPSTSDMELLEDGVVGLRADGSTSLYDAIAVGLLQMEGVKGRRALVVLSDGADSTSRYGATDIAELAKRSHVPIHLIAVPPENAFLGSGDRSWAVMYQALSRMAESTGGSAYTLKNIDDLPQVYEQIEAALRSQVLLIVGTEPGKGADEWRAVKVGFETRTIRMHAPDGYYAPW
ncbi:MAG: VWA domain-containing protein [Acidobacteria bacterium]|nr:VWA domain-containing protein [Acidobacteriota bacterium]